jgi:hypothetical protein
VARALRKYVCAAMLIGLLVAATGRANASLETFTPADGPSPAAVTAVFGTLVAGGAAAENYITFGVDFNKGPTVGVFVNGNLPRILAFGGINANNQLDLITEVDGRVVVAGTSNQGLTDFIGVSAGNADQGGNLLLRAYDINGNLVGSAVNPASGISSFSVGTAGVFNIASFIVSTPAPGGSADTFGVQSIALDTPVAVAPVPEPSTLVLTGIGGLLGLGYSQRRTAA